MLWTGNSSEHPKTRDQQKHDNYRNIGVRAIFCRGGGGGKPFTQKILAGCPNFYKTVEQKRSPYDATTYAALAYESVSIQFFRVHICEVFF